MKCPPIPFTNAEVRREAFLWRLAAAWQEQMTILRNPCALKGGTGLRFQAQLPRPSTDLDFEGDGRIRFRETLTKAATAAAGAQAHRVGPNYLWKGTATVRVLDATAGWLNGTVDYRRTGSRSGMPDRVPLDRCEQVRGIIIYTARELVTRKLQTVIGKRARQKARDIYDAAWIVSERPDLVGPADAKKLQQWVETTPAHRDTLARRLESGTVTQRVSSSQVLEALVAGVRRLQQTARDPASRAAGDAAGPGSGNGESGRYPNS